VLEGELRDTFIALLDRGERERDVVLQRSPTLRAESRVVPVGMSTAGTEQPAGSVRATLEAKVVDGTRPSTLDTECTVSKQLGRVNFPGLRPSTDEGGRPAAAVDTRGDLAWRVRLPG
jgi:hypothetical protein